MGFNRFDVLIRLVFPEGAGGRLGRIFGVETRTGQRWAKAEMPLPAEVETWLNDQEKRVLAAGAIDQELEDYIERLRARGLHDESIASYLAHAHNKAVGRTIR